MAAMLAALDALGGNLVQDEGVTYEGTRVILPAQMEGNLKGAIRYLEQVRANEEQDFDFSRTFHYRPWDGAAAFQRAMQRVFGTSGIGKTTYDFFGEHPPQLVSIPVGLNEYIQAPWGTITFALLDATFELGGKRDAEYGPCFHVTINAPRKHRRRIEGFLNVVEDELKQRSIYRGKMINAAVDPGFINAYSHDAAKIVYANDVFTQLEANVWTVLKNADYYRSVGIPLKRAFLLEGPYGSGKSLAGVLTAQHALENGWTFILVRSGEDPYDALKTARIYAPSVVWVEDIDILIANRSREEITRLLDALDSVSTKGAEVVAGYTTNFPDVIDQAVLRPGRLDAVIHIGELDPDGHERLIKAVSPAGVLDANIDWAKVIVALDKYLPAFTVEAAQRAVRYAVARGDTGKLTITTEDLVTAAEGLRLQFNMAMGANEAAHAKPSFEKLFTGVVEDVNRRTALLGDQFDVVSKNGASR